MVANTREREKRVDRRMAAASCDDVRATVLEILKSLKPPVHIAALSIQYAQRKGHSVKLDYKGGMLKFVRAELAEDVVIMGEGNDTFLRVASPTTRAAQWVRDCIGNNGPILALSLIHI